MIHGARGALDQEIIKPKSVRATLQRLARYFRPYWLILLIVLLLMIANTWVQVITPQLIGQATDCYMTPGVANTIDAPALDSEGGVGSASAANCWFADVPADATNDVLTKGLLRISLILVALFAIGSVVGGLVFFLMSWAGNHVLRELEIDVFEKLQRLSIGYHTEHDGGDLMSRITNDTGTIQQAISFALVQVVSGGMLLVWLAYKMIAINPAYGLISLTAVPVMILTTVWFSNRARAAFRITRSEMGNVNTELEESISGVREVQAFSRESANIESFRESNAANRDANIRAVAYTSALAPTLEALGYVATALVLGVGGYFALSGMTLSGAMVSIGLIVTYLGYVRRFNQPIQQISVLWTNLQSAIAGAERIFEILDVPADIVEAPDATDMPQIIGRVVYDDVHAEYVTDEPVLRGVNLIAEQGQTIAIVGPTGAGKTTLINLLPRFYDVTGGSVTIDGVDVRTVNLESLRKQIGIVLQDSYLFSNTIMENIRFGRPGATDDEVIAAAKLARAHDFIERQVGGYQTEVGERGSSLSQGQRQLISIARAALADPQILILDEATSSVDTRTERHIQSALNAMMTDRTSFVIAHRLSTIRTADQVLVLVDGEIVERGRHEELLAHKGVYYDLYMSQFRRQESVAEVTVDSNESE